ncbi:hypothetical protein [Vogesella indigofera]|nr:hypothetical protein [Vogesella indigofera]MDC7707714.1 hypothetical protein [Vogesella indigofera]
MMMRGVVEPDERVRVARMGNAVLFSQQGLRIRRQPFLTVHREDRAAAQ